MTCMGIVKRFIVQSKVLEITIGMIVAVAFDRVVLSAVSGILMPLIKLSRSAWAGDDGTIPERAGSPSASKGTVVVEFGTFVEAVVVFLIIVFFIVRGIKTIERLRKKEEAKPTGTASEPEHLF